MWILPACGWFGPHDSLFAADTVLFAFEAKRKRGDEAHCAECPIQWKRHEQWGRHSCLPGRKECLRHLEPPKGPDMTRMRSTTILAVRHRDTTAIGGDGQV